MTRQLVGQVDGLMCSPLRHHDDTPNLFHLGVVWWTGAIQVARNLKQQMVSVKGSYFFTHLQTTDSKIIKQCFL